MRVAVHECFFQSCQPANLAQVLATDCTMLQRVIKAFVSSAESSITHTIPGWPMLYDGYAVQELLGPDAELNKVRESRPEADDNPQQSATLRQAHPHAAPKVCMSLIVLVCAVCIGQLHGSSSCLLACTMVYVQVAFIALQIQCCIHSGATTTDSIHDTVSQHGVEGELKWLAVGVIDTQRMRSLSVVTPLLRQQMCCSVLIFGEQLCSGAVEQRLP